MCIDYTSFLIFLTRLRNFPGEDRFKRATEKTEPEYTCPEDGGNGNFADPATCRRFYQVTWIFGDH
jgi:hypothetical protein